MWLISGTVETNSVPCLLIDGKITVGQIGTIPVVDFDGHMVLRVVGFYHLQL